MSGTDQNIISGFMRNKKNTDLFVHFMQGTSKRYWIFCNPVLEESVFIRPFYQELAYDLYHRGDSIIQFDYAGCGESCGEFGEVTTSSMMQDIEAIIQHIKEQPTLNEIILFGMRVGANLALNVASEYQLPCLSWFPVTDGDRFSEDLLLTNMSVQLSAFKKVITDKEKLIAQMNQGIPLNTLGYPIHKGLFNDLKKLSINDIKQPLPEHLHLYINQHPANRKVIAEIKNNRLNATLIKAKPFWHEPKCYPDKQPELLQAAHALVEGL